MNLARVLQLINDGTDILAQIHFILKLQVQYPLETLLFHELNSYFALFIYLSFHIFYFKGEKKKPQHFLCVLSFALYTKKPTYNFTCFFYFKFKRNFVHQLGLIALLLSLIIWTLIQDRALFFWTFYSSSEHSYTYFIFFYLVD